MKNEEQLTLLFEKYISNECSLEEAQELMDYFHLYNYQDLLQKLIFDTISKDNETLQLGPEVANLIAKVDIDLFSQIYGLRDTELPKSRINNNLWRRITMAVAATLILTFIGTYIFKTNKASVTKKEDSLAQSITHGKIGATLTLANGKKIILSEAAEGRLAEEAGVSVVKSPDDKLIYIVQNSAVQGNRVNTLSTANGETYQLHLPDGSLVWLNSASSLTFNTSLDEKGKRIVKLKGEAYFEVAKDKQHPFIVKTNKQEVQVLGTHFNVNSYIDEPAVITTLLEGLVKVTAGKDVKILKPGQQSLNDGIRIQIANVNTQNIIDWKDGDFFLDGIDFKTAMRKIARWYDVEVVYEPSVSEDIKSGGWISRNNSLSTVLKSIESSGQVHFKVEGRKIYVTK